MLYYLIIITYFLLAYIISIYNVDDQSRGSLDIIG